jgi:membrane protein insertase Oxa1/YidC/SpoIIIJ
MVDINATIPLLGPISSTVQEILNTVSLLVGGIFGIYVITLIVRLIFFKKLLDLYKEIKNSMEKMESKIDKLGKKKK